jgi:hypothetical protein
MTTLLSQLVEKLEKTNEIEHRPSKVAGGSAIFFKGKEVAHFHSNNEIDIRLTKSIIKTEGLEHPADSKFHTGRKPGSQWIELSFRTTSQVDEIIRLFKLALKQY